MPLVLCALTLATPVEADWPGWRGPGGSGVALEADGLPSTWEPDGRSVLWRTPIPGEGISSPIVSGGRVFVTTAYEGAGGRLLRTTLVVLTLGLALASLWLIGRDRSRSGEGDRSSRIGRIDRWIVLAASAGTIALAVALAVRPGLLLEAGNPGRAWRLGGAVALLGLAAAFGWSGRRSRWRLVGVLAVFSAAVLMVRLAPAGPLGPPRFSKLLPFLFLGCATALWYLAALFGGSSRDDSEPTGRPLAPAPALALIALAMLAFVPSNYLTSLQRVVVCLDLETGEILWETPVLSGPPEQKWHHSTFATPTPVTDGERVFAYFGHGVAGVDLEGRLLWTRMFPDYAGTTRYGAGASPIVTDEAVVVVREREHLQADSSSWIVALEKTSGETLWKVEPRGAHDSYTTPIVVPSVSGDLVATASWKSLVAYRPDSGESAWSLEYPMEQMVASPILSGDKLVLTGGVYGEKTLMVLGLDREEGDGRPEILWETGRGVASIASPVAYDGVLYTVTTPGILTARDLETGDELWKMRLTGEFFASLVAGDGKVYATSTEGTTSVLAAGREPELLAENELGESVYASPAIAGDSLFLRTADALYRIER